jgi:hypothetical protein
VSRKGGKYWIPASAGMTLTDFLKLPLSNEPISKLKKSFTQAETGVQGAAQILDSGFRLPPE